MVWVCMSDLFASLYNYCSERMRVEFLSKGIRGILLSSGCCIKQQRQKIKVWPVFFHCKWSGQADTKTTVCLSVYEHWCFDDRSIFLRWFSIQMMIVIWFRCELSLFFDRRDLLVVVRWASRWIFHINWNEWRILPILLFLLMGVKSKKLLDSWF